MTAPIRGVPPPSKFGDDPAPIRAENGLFRVTMTGKNGQKTFTAGDRPYPNDVWIVDAQRFAATYERE